MPGKAPELNPDEGVWNLLKRGELKHRRSTHESAASCGVLLLPEWIFEESYSSTM